MRTLHARTDWIPRGRIDGLRRYAFIGDSMAYGAGVAPDETLPAAAERQMNELSPGCPVECVNLGVSGYNLFNAWLGFTQLPQVYDGLVVVVCNNDAELFSRSCGVRFSDRREQTWQPPHPCAEAAARCMADIAAAARAQALHIVVLYYDITGVAAQAAVAERIAGLCRSLDLPFFNSFDYLRGRLYTLEERRVSAVDMHPSALAHDIVARQLCADLKRLGWFAHADPAGIDAAPARVLAAARGMVDGDDYPPDAAMNWASRALETQTRVARRRHALGAEDDFSSVAAKAVYFLSNESRRWHAIQRSRAFVQDVTAGTQNIPGALWQAQELRMRLEELGFALRTGAWNRIDRELDWPAVTLQETSDNWLHDALQFLQACRRDTQRVRETLDDLRNLAVPAAIGPAGTEWAMLSDLDTVVRLVDRLDGEYRLLLETFASLADACGETEAAASVPAATRLQSLLGQGLKHLRSSQGFLQWLPAAVERIGDPSPAAFTTIELTVSAAAIADAKFAILTARADYLVPARLPAACSGHLPLDGSRAFITLHVPTLYAGRLTLSTFLPKLREPGSGDVTFTRIEVYNRTAHRRIVESRLLHYDGQRFQSPLIVLS